MIHPDDTVVYVRAGMHAEDEACVGRVLACFSDDGDGDWFTVAGEHGGGTALRVRDEGVTWSRSLEDRDVLLAAFKLSR